MRYIISILLGFSLILLGGCRDIQIKTIINNDGTITRTYVIVQDIQFKKKNFTNITDDEKTNEINRQIESSYFPVDTGWDTKFSFDTIDKETTIRFTKTYKNIKKLQQELRDKDYKLKLLHPKVEINRTFNWFNTINTYKESYNRIFHGQPYEEFFTKEEIKKIREGNINDNDSAQLKYYAWVAYAVIDEVIIIINNETDSVFNLNAWKKFMYDKIAENTFSDPSKENNPFMIPEINKKQEDMDYTDSDMLISSLKRYSDIDIPKEKEKKVHEILKEKMDIYMSLFTDKLRFSVQMPGKIDNNNGDSIKGNTVYWKMNPFIAGAPVEMVLKTRQSNAGIPITIVVIIIAFLSYLLMRKRRR